MSTKRWIYLTLAPVLVVGLFGMPTGSVRAATLDVCTSGCTYSTIQDAINAAVSGDTITIANGTYTLSSGLLVYKSISLVGSSQAGVIIDASSIPSGYGIDVNGDFTTTFQNFTLRGPSASTNG